MRTGADIIKTLTPAPVPAYNAWNTIRTGNRNSTARDPSCPNAKESNKENTNGCDLRMEITTRTQKLNTTGNITNRTGSSELVCVGDNTTVIRPKFKNKTWSRKDATSTIKGRSRRRTGSLRTIHPGIAYPNVAMTNELFGGNSFSQSPGSYGGLTFGVHRDLMPPVYPGVMCANGPMPMRTQTPVPIPIMGHKSDNFAPHQLEGHGANMGVMPLSPINPYYHLHPPPPIDMYKAPFHSYYHPIYLQVNQIPILHRIHEIKNQVLYYFSSKNLGTDVYLKSLIDNRTGGVPLIELIKFKRLNAMTNNGRDITILQDVIKYECFPELELIQMSQGVGVRSIYWRNWVT